LNRTFKAVLSTLLTVAALLTWSTPGSAQRSPQRSPQGGVTAMGIGDATSIKFDPTWIRFRPNPRNGEHLELRPGTDVATICWQRGDDGKLWNLVIDHDRTFAGWTHAENLWKTSNNACTSIGEKSGISRNPEAWVRLHPKDSWAHESIYRQHDIATICTVYGERGEWDLILDHDNRVAGFMPNEYLDEISSRYCYA
jgi:hypothetical protein